MHRNRNLAMKLQHQQRRQAMRRTESTTPRVDNFIETMPRLVLDHADFADRDALVRVTVQMREHMLGWTEFARTLERELMQSVPKEWSEAALLRRDK